MAKHAGLVLVAAAAFLLGLANVQSSIASNPPTMRLDPASVKIQGTVGATFTVDVLIEGVTNLGGIEFEIHYDDGSLNLDGITEGPFLSSAGGAGYVVCNKSNVAQGVGHFGCVILGKPYAPSGSGVIAQLDFSLAVPFLSPGQLELSLMACDAADSQGDPIVLNGCKDGAVTVNAAPTVPPTATPPPAAIGGIALDADVGTLAAQRNQPTSGLFWTGALASVTVGAIALGAAAWYAQSRRSK